MLQVAVIRDQTDRILEGLRKRNIKNAPELIQEVIDNDLLRRDTQKTLDDLKSKSNLDSKKIGELMKSGRAEEAASMRSSIAVDKENVKKLETDLNVYEKKQLELLYKIPN